MRGSCSRSGVTATRFLGFGNPDQRDQSDKDPGREIEHIVHAQRRGLLAQGLIERAVGGLSAHPQSLQLADRLVEDRIVEIGLFVQLRMMQDAAMVPCGGEDRRAYPAEHDTHEVRQT